MHGVIFAQAAIAAAFIILVATGGLLLGGIAFFWYYFNTKAHKRGTYQDSVSYYCRLFTKSIAASLGIVVVFFLLLQLWNPVFM